MTVPLSGAMRILYHHRTASKDGQAVHIEEMIQALRSLGHDVHIVGPAAPDPGGQAMGDEVGWVSRLRSTLPRALYELLELGYSLLAYTRLARAVRDFKPDIVYERYNLFLLSGWLVKKRHGLPLLLEVNAPLADEREQFSGGLSLRRLAHWTEGLVWRGADVVLPVTRVLAADIARKGVPPERLAVIANGINEEHFQAAPAPAAAKAALGWPDAFVLGFTGFVRDWHGVDRVLHWLASADAPPQARLLMVGDGPARPALEALALQLGLTERVRFTGVIPRAQVPAHVAAFDIALQPAVVAYASPLKLFEYLALGKVIVAPRLPNIEEVLVDGDNALLFDAQAPQALEQALTRLCRDTALRQRLAAGSGATIDRLGLTWRANAQRVVALGGALLKREPLPATLAARPGAAADQVRQP